MEREGAGDSTRPPPREAATSARATATFLVLLLVGAGFVLPEGGSYVADLLNTNAAHGSFLHDPNGTIYASALLGQNISNPTLFWLRPSLIDDQAFLGAGGESPPGPTDPALLNETRYYISLEGLNNSTVPLDLVSPSASGLDPDLTPSATLVQIPRVALHSHLSEAFLLAFVNARIHHPALGVFGPSYVNVLRLDVSLLPYLPQGTGPKLP
ncbi:MAG: potassium-transporting ATPase subunit C [Thermoplasmata archaeon]|nr:potassium-transporting ATPase subunit C [Thermoplasmata archaeon]